MVKYFRRAREQTKIKLTKNLLTIIKTTIIYGTKTSCAPLCTVHKGRFNAMYKSTEYLLPSVTVQDIVPPRCKKNGHSVDSLRGKCPMIVPFFFSQSQHIDLECCTTWGSPLIGSTMRGKYPLVTTTLIIGITSSKTIGNLAFLPLLCPGVLVAQSWDHLTSVWKVWVWVSRINLWVYFSLS